jgi:hypothetical protein
MLLTPHPNVTLTRKEGHTQLENINAGVVKTLPLNQNVITPLF